MLFKPKNNPIEFNCDRFYLKKDIFLSASALVHKSNHLATVVYCQRNKNNNNNEFAELNRSRHFYCYGIFSHPLRVMFYDVHTWRQVSYQNI
jgi:hypothetical protein